MKRLFAGLAIFIPLLAVGQTPPQRQAFTTNSATVVTNIIRRIATNAFSAGSGITINGGVIALYSAPTISVFTNDQNSVETGATVANTILGWTLGGGSINEQHLNQGIGLLSDSERHYIDTADYTTSRTYTLTVTDGVTSNTANTSITFYSKAYWGVSALTTLSDGQIQALSQEFATSRARTKSVSPSSQYIYVAYPAAFGTASFRVNGFTDTAWTLEGGAAQDFINASGATVSYYVYRSNDQAVGTFEVEVY